MRTRLLLIASTMLISWGVFAQPQGGERPEPPKMLSPEEYAQEQADLMKTEVGLDDEQYQKIYKFFKKDQEYRQSQMQNAFGGGMPPQGGFGGGGMMGGGPGGDMMGGGGMGGPGGGMPGGGGMGAPSGAGGQGMRPSGPPPSFSGQIPVSEKYIQKQDEKLKKILTTEQYNKWRENHPIETAQLPEIEME